MNRRYHTARPLLLALAVLLLGQSTALAQSSNPVITRLKAKYDEIDALRAGFTQTMSSAYSEGEETFSGTLVLQGDKFRVETGNQTLVTDGAVTWIYNAADNQVLINDATEDETSFSINDFLFNFDDRYEVTEAEPVRIDGQRHYRLHLQPRAAESFFRDVTLWVRDRDTIITQLEVTDMNETKMVFHLSEVELNPRVDRSTFTFKPPQGAEVIDLRS